GCCARKLGLCLQCSAHLRALCTAGAVLAGWAPDGSGCAAASRAVRARSRIAALGSPRSAASSATASARQAPRTAGARQVRAGGLGGVLDGCRGPHRKPDQRAEKAGRAQLLTYSV